MHRPARSHDVDSENSGQIGRVGSPSRPLLRGRLEHEYDFQPSEMGSIYPAVIQRAHHVLHNFPAVRLAGALLSRSAPPVHDHDAIRHRKNVRQRMADENDRHLLLAQFTNACLTISLVSL